MSSNLFIKENFEYIKEDIYGNFVFESALLNEGLTEFFEKISPMKLFKQITGIRQAAKNMDIEEIKKAADEISIKLPDNIDILKIGKETSKDFEKYFKYTSMELRKRFPYVNGDMIRNFSAILTFKALEDSNPERFLRENIEKYVHLINKTINEKMNNYDITSASMHSMPISHHDLVINDRDRKAKIIMMSFLFVSALLVGSTLYWKINPALKNKGLSNIAPKRIMNSSYSIFMEIVKQFLKNFNIETSKIKSAAVSGWNK